MVAKKAPARKAAAPKNTYSYAGKTWKLKEPNAVLFGSIMDSESIASLGLLAEAYVIKDQRADFRAAMLEDEDLDFAKLDKMIEAMSKVVFPKVPTAP